MITALNLVTLYTSLTALKKSFINSFLSTIQLPQCLCSIQLKAIGFLSKGSLPLYGEKVSTTFMYLELQAV